MQQTSPVAHISTLTGTVQGIKPVDGLYLATIRGKGPDCTIATDKPKDLDRLRKAMSTGMRITLQLLPFTENHRPAGSELCADGYLHSVQGY